MIAHALNTEGEPGPRGAVDGPRRHLRRRSRDGILCKELYIDVRAYDLRSFKRHPDTARRCGRLNPESEWLREPVPWRSLVVDDLWIAVQARLKAAGLGMTLNGGWFACSTAHERGTCTNKKLIAAKTIEAGLMGRIVAKLLAPKPLPPLSALPRPKPSSANTRR